MFDYSSASRRGIFYLKADIPADDARLRDLRDTRQGEANARIGAVVKAVEAFTAKTVGNVAAYAMQGTFHLMHQATLTTGEKLIVRSAVDGLFATDASMRLEAYAQGQMAALKLPSVKVHGVDTRRIHAPFDFMIMDEAKGKMLEEDMMDKPARIEALGAFLKRCHAMPAAGAGLIDLEALEGGTVKGVHDHWYDYLLLNIEAHMHACAQAQWMDAKDLLRVLRWFSTRRDWFNARPVCMLHGNPVNHDFFMEKLEATALLDWEDALAGDPLYDVALWASFHPEQRWSAFFTGYGIDARSLEFAVPFTLYFLRITLARLVCRQRFGHVDAEGDSASWQQLTNALRLVENAMKREKS